MWSNCSLNFVRINGLKFDSWKLFLFLRIVHQQCSCFSLTLEAVPRSPITRNNTRKSKRKLRYNGVDMNGVSDDVLVNTDLSRWYYNVDQAEIPNEVWLQTWSNFDSFHPTSNFFFFFKILLRWKEIIPGKKCHNYFIRKCFCEKSYQAFYFL